MKRENWPALMLCGLVTGILFFVLTAVTLSFFARDVVSVLQASPTHPKLSGGFFFAVDLLMGMWTIWLYSAISSRYGSGLRTALIAGLAWWAMKSLQSANWVGLGFVSLGVVPVPFVTSLISATCAAVAGALLYEKVQRQPSSVTRPRNPE